MALTRQSMPKFFGNIDLNPFDEDYEKEGEASWLFTPSIIREIFKLSLMKTKASYKTEDFK